MNHPEAAGPFRSASPGGRPPAFARGKLLRAVPGMAFGPHEASRIDALVAARGLQAVAR